MEKHPHGAENAEFEIKKAYDHVVGVGTVFAGRALEGVDVDLVFAYYRRAYDALRDGNRLGAERWARTTKHLARALWHEAKIAYLRGHDSVVPFLNDANEVYGLQDRPVETTADLLQSVSIDPPPGFTQVPQEINRFLGRGRFHLEALNDPSLKHELIRAELIKAAHQYGRVCECLALALGAENKTTKEAA